MAHTSSTTEPLHRWKPVSAAAAAAAGSYYSIRSGSADGSRRARARASASPSSISHSEIITKRHPPPLARTVVLRSVSGRPADPIIRRRFPSAPERVRTCAPRARAFGIGVRTTIFNLRSEILIEREREREKLYLYLYIYALLTGCTREGVIVLAAPRHWYFV